MAVAKTRTSIWATTSQAAAATTTGASVDLSAAVAAQAEIKITNGGTGPTLPAQVQIQTSGDNTSWFDYGPPLVGGVAASAPYSWSVELPFGAKNVRLVGSGNTGQAVTLDAAVVAVTL